MGLFAQVPLVVSFYTKKTLYEEAGEALIASCVKFGIEYDIEAVETLGSWEENCSRKPGFLVQKMQEHARPLLWVDADALFLRPLVFEEFMFYDMAIMRYQEEDPRFAVGAGTVYINATQKGREALVLWNHYARSLYEAKGNAVPFLDQMSLYLLLRSAFPASFAPLPLRYCRIFDHTDAEDVVIEHYQASRRR